MRIVSVYAAADKHLQFALFSSYFKYFPLCKRKLLLCVSKPPISLISIKPLP